MGVGNRDGMVWREGHLPSDLKSTPGMSSSILLAYRASARLFKRKARFVFLTRFSPTLLDSFPETAQAPKKRCFLVGRDMLLVTSCLESFSGCWLIRSMYPFLLFKFFPNSSFSSSWKPTWFCLS